MTQKELIKEVEKIAEEQIDKSYQTKYKAIIVENYVKFLDNESRISEKKKLLKVLKNVKWYSNHNTDLFFSNVITEFLSELVGSVYFICKNKVTSSCFSIVTNLLREGKLEEKEIIIYDKKTKKLEEKQIENNTTILLMDDYAGSGNTIINIINEIEEKYSDMKVLILIYIWQEEAIKNIKNELTKKTKNDYKIIEKGIVLENSYKEKFNADVGSIRYIEEICNGCQQKEMKYGYMQTGAMLTFNGISPNNNISMLWNNHINYKNRKWSPIFNREYALDFLIRKKNNYLIKKKNEMWKIYNSSFLKKKITYQDFKVLVILFNTYNIRPEYIKEIMGFDSIEEVIKVLEKFTKSGIIKYSTDNILEFMDRKILNEMRKIDERISKDVGIIKGTRKQISKKITPLEQ